METEFSWPVRIYYEDTDAAGVVYYANYLRFFERARTEWLRTFGFEQNVLASNLGVVFVVRRVEVDYLIPAKFNDYIVIKTLVEKSSGVRMFFVQTALRQEHVLAKATVQVVCVDAATFYPCAIPTTILEKVACDA